MSTEEKTQELRLVSPIWVGLVDEEYGGSPECLYDSAIEYEADIRAALFAFLEKEGSGRDLMAGFSLPEAQELEAAIRSKVSAARLDVSAAGGSLRAAVKVETSASLTREELDALMEQIEAQYRDGWGSAFELEDIPAGRGGVIYARLHHSGFELRAETAGRQPGQEAVEQRAKPDFFERELRKIVGARHPDAVFAGRACYLRLDERNRAKIQFVSLGVAGEYPALGVTVLSRQAGEVDQITLRFGDVLGPRTDPAANAPFAWEYPGGAEWYGFRPAQEDYQAISGALERYLEVFQEQAPAAETRWQPAMR